MKSFIGTCIKNPFGRIEDLVFIIENAAPIHQEEFIANCNLSEQLITKMKKYLTDYEYYKYKGTMFYRYDDIEYFYQ